MRMSAARKLITTVQPGGRIEVTSPELTVGQPVEVSIRLLPAPQRRSILEILADCPGGVLVHTADEVDAYLRAERDAWKS
jgi:hypothetical protein